MEKFTLVLKALSVFIPEQTWQHLWQWAQQRQTGALLITRNGRIEYEGYANGQHAGKLVAVCSFAKTLPALLVGRAIEDGYITSLDDPVSRYLSEWRGDPRGAITLHDLLTWSSGLATVRMDSRDPNNRTLKLAEGSKVEQQVLSWPMEHQPDTVFTVNQVDQQLTALALERATTVEEVTLMSHLKNKVAIITGGAASIGQNITRELHAQGTKVVIAARSADKGNKLADELGDDAIYVQTDITDDSQLNNLINQTVEKFGGLNILINNACSYDDDDGAMMMGQKLHVIRGYPLLILALFPLLF